MDAEKLTKLIQRLEHYSKTHATAYRFRVAALAALGYGYLLAVVLLLLFVIYLVLAKAAFNWVTLKFAWILLVLAWMVLRAMWVTVPEPDGVELKYEDAPRLFDLVNEVREALHGPKAHRILLASDFNAGIVQIPRMGMFGWSRNYLVIGLPFLSALTPEEFRAVLAHEFGHLSGNHGRFSGWIYRLRQTWIQLLTTIHQEKRYARFLFEWFLKWYAPFFNAYSFVLARIQEYEADRYSVDLSGKTVAARTLVRVTTKENALAEYFWPKFYAAAEEESQPPKDPFGRMLLGLEMEIGRNDAERWYLQALRTRTGYDDTHPSLSDRLVGLGFEKESLIRPSVFKEFVVSDVAPDKNAREFYLDSVPDGIVASFNRLYRERIVPVWRNRLKVMGEARARLTELSKKEGDKPLTEDELWERARLLDMTESPVAAIPTLKLMIEQNPNLAGVSFALGSILLSEEDESGLKLLEKSIELDDANTANACDLIYHFHRRHGREDQADPYRVRIEQHIQAQEKKYQAAVTLTPEDRFEPHGLNPEELARCQSKLIGVRRLGKVFLVRKILDDPTEFLFVMGVITSYAWHDFHTRQDSDAVLDQLNANLESSHPLMLVLLEGKHKYLRKVFSEIPSAEVFPCLASPQIQNSTAIRTI